MCSAEGFELQPGVAWSESDIVEFECERESSRNVWIFDDKYQPLSASSLQNHP